MTAACHKIRAGIALALLPLLAGAADDSCRLCSAPTDAAVSEERRETPLSIDITTNLDFSKAAQAGSGGGRISVNPNDAGRRVEGLIDLGGYPIAGSAIIRGEPGRSVRVEMPAQVRMTSSTGGVVNISELKTDLPPAPRLDAAGQLRFQFGGQLEVNGNMAGTFRGRFPITANYE